MSGLLNRSSKTSLPLRSSSIYTDIKGFTAKTTAILTYYNDNRTEIEGLFVLPVDHGSAIVDFECVIEGHYIYADVRDVNDANNLQAKYENEPSYNGVFNISIGRIPPWILIEIQVTIVCEITVIFFGDALKYTLPQTFSPKLASKLEDENTTLYTAISTLGYTFQLEIFIEAPCLLCGVQSNTHPIQVDAPPLSNTGSKIKVTLPEDFEPTNDIFELLMFLCRPREPYIIIEQPSTIADVNELQKQKNPINNIMNNSILMLSYSPDISNFQKELDENLTNQVAEFLLIFQSFTEFTVIRDTCKLFLKSLPHNCIFNMMYMGNTIDTLFDTSQTYSSKTIEQAFTYISNKLKQKTNSHPSSLLDAIKWIYNEKNNTNIPRQSFIISEGKQPLNNNEIIELARKRHHLVRFFSVYLGSGDVSIYKSLSSITNGNCYHVESVNMVSKQLITCLKAALKPAVTNLNISWILPDAYDVIYTPENLPVLYLGNRLNLYAILDVKEHENTLTRHKPSAESINSIKEFWFEDYDFFDEFTEGQHNCLSHDLLTEIGTNEINSPHKSKENLAMTNDNLLLNQELENENDVFLTDEEATQLKHKIGWQKRLSVDRVQKWRVSKNPENTDLDNVISDTDSDIYLQYQYQKADRRKKSSSDGIESLGSSNSYGSNLSSSSHFLAFPGYPTRLSSCRSVEARSPHMQKLPDDVFHFSAEYVKERHLSVERLYSIGQLDDVPEDFPKTTKSREKKKLTQALLNEHVNTHLLDHSNENLIYKLIEGIVTEKRVKLSDWVNVQEEMTQCNWPLEETEKKMIDAGGWRDSGIGHRSSSEPHTSDLEDELNGRAMKKSSSSYLLHKKKQSEDSFETKSLNCDMKSLERYNVPHNVSSEPDILETKKTFFGMKTKKHSRSEFVPPTPKSVPNEKSSFKKRIKAKTIWNSIVDKVKNLTTSVSPEKSGEATFQITDIEYEPDTFIKNDNIKSVAEKINENFNSLNESKKPEVNIIAEVPSSSKFQEEKQETLNEKTGKERKSEQSKHRVLKTRPLIENSRTISTSSMIEIGQTEIGDIDSLHLLPSQALIYLSGNFGNRKFKRIIPFQMDLTATQEEMISEFTIHQLAAKSIIRDLEIQMDQDLLLENTGRNYIKTLVGEVSRSAHILSKHTTVVMIDDMCEENQVLSIVKQNNKKTSATSLQRPSYLNINSMHDTNEQLYEIHREKKTISSNSDNTTKVYHTKLILKSPSFQESHAKLQHSDSKDTFLRLGYMKLVDLMNAEGYWEISHLFAETLTVNYSQLRESCPFADVNVKNQTSHKRRTAKPDKIYDHIWTTTLALVWVNFYWKDLQEEWVLIDEKAQKWLKRKKLPTGFILDDVFVIAQQTLKILKGSSRKSSIR